MLRKDTLRLLNILTNHDRSQVNISAGIHNALGIALPLIIGLSMGKISSGIVATVGALVAGFAGTSGTMRRRVRTMLLSSIWIGLATFIGSISGHNLVISMILMMGSAFLSGLMNAVGPGAAQIGLLATNAFIIFSYFHGNLIYSLNIAWLVMSGGILQILFMFMFLWFHPLQPEASMVAKAYQILANYAVSRTRTTDLQVARILVLAGGELNDSYQGWHHAFWRKQYIILHELIKNLEIIRNDLVGIEILSKRLTGLNDTVNKHVLEDVFCAIAHLLDIISLHITKGRGRISSMKDGHLLLSHLIDAEQHLQASAVLQIEDTYTTQEIFSRLQHIQTIFQRILDVMAQEEQPLETYKLEKIHTFSGYLNFWHPLRNIIGILRANLTFRSSAFRHALRLSITLGFAVLLYHVFGMTRGYWIPLTVLVILRPDFFTTFGRGIARVIGTLAGVLLATGLLLVPDQQHIWSVLLIILFGTGMYAILNYNYAIFTGLITAEIVILLSFFESVPPITAMHLRLVDTLIGSAFAFAAYLIWPTWGHRNVPQALAGLLAAERRYFIAILNLYSEYEREAPLFCQEDVEKFRKETRLARTNTATLIEQAVNEPIIRTLDFQAVVGLLISLHRFAELLMTLESSLALMPNPVRSDRISLFYTFALHLDEMLARIEERIEKTNLYAQQHNSKKLDDTRSMNLEILDKHVRPDIQCLLNQPKVIDHQNQPLKLTDSNKDFFTITAMRLTQSVSTMIRMLP